jgi:D-3-phosphoglycerate dehydrogenase / 2-oxoglutarate reductase
VRRVLLTAAFDPSVEGLFDRLRDGPFELVRRHDLAGSAAEDALIDALHGMWAVIAGNERYTRRVLESAPDLRVIGRPGVGYDAVDLEAATERGIGVFITPGTNHEAVADLTLALMLATLRRVALLDRTIRTGGWRINGLARDLHGSTVGVVGLGLIGRAVVRRLSGFNCRIVAAEPKPERAFCEEYRVRLGTLDDFLPEVDVITLHLPLDGSTRHLVDRVRLAQLRPTAVLINTSRGAIVDQGALVDALAAGRLGGAGIDVFEDEPLPPEDPLVAFDNVVLTSHVGSHTTDAMTQMIEATIDGVRKAARGIAPSGCLNPTVFQSSTSAA